MIIPCSHGLLRLLCCSPIKNSHQKYHCSKATARNAVSKLVTSSIYSRSTYVHVYIYISIYRKLDTERERDGWIERGWDSCQSESIGPRMPRASLAAALGFTSASSFLSAPAAWHGFEGMEKDSRHDLNPKWVGQQDEINMKLLWNYYEIRINWINPQKKKKKTRVSPTLSIE